MKRLPNKAIIRSALGLGIILGMTLFAGCAAVGPEYVAPETPVAAQWHTRLPGQAAAQDADPQTLAQWWTGLDDPLLTGLMERAVSGNLDLKKAVTRVVEARALRGQAEADRFPTLDAGGSVGRSRTLPAKGSGSTSSLYSAAMDAAWELDVFGGVRRSIEASDANLMARNEELRDVLVTLLAEVALNYIEVRTYQTRLAVARENLKAQEETWHLTVWRHQAGLGDELAVEQARYNLESTRSQIPSLKSGLDQAMNGVAVLLGEQPGAVNAELASSGPIPVADVQVAVGVPADVLRQRPDIRQAERELAAQTARIGVAQAELYPKFKLSGSIGLETVSSRNLISSGAASLRGGPGVTWRIFDAGSIRRNIEAQTAVRDQYLIAYETAVLNALEEVENALTAFAREQDRRVSLKETVRAAQRAADLAKSKYEAGLADFSDVLDAQRSLLSFQDQLAQSGGTVTSNLVRLYKALGGGWTSYGP